jgi:RNA polymerase sigma factor (sigma-70 family)
MGEPKKAFVERLFLRHRDALQTFFYRRIRTKADAADLAQEVYLRMLRVNDTDDILNPAAYLYAVAGNLLRENAAKDRRQADGIKVEDDDSAQQLSELPEWDDKLDARRRVERLRAVLKQLPPKCCAAVVLRYRYELSVHEIAERLDVSTYMVKKYLGQGLSLCRRRMASLG